MTTPNGAIPLDRVIGASVPSLASAADAEAIEGSRCASGWPR
ncbi:MAG: hypothetical protein R3E48_15620 [Burkholderiaceae bacterium]